MFFKTTANVPDGEKARIEFHLQQIAESIGMDRLRLPLVPMATFEKWANETPEQIIALVGDHLSHDVGQFGFQAGPPQSQQCGGGG